MGILSIKIDNRTYDFDTKITEVEADLTNSRAELNTKIQKVLDDLSTVKDSLQSGETYNINITMLLPQQMRIRRQKILLVIQ